MSPRRRAFAVAVVVAGHFWHRSIRWSSYEPGWKTKTTGPWGHRRAINEAYRPGARKACA